ncbi:alpha-E domain-containing protein [Kiloniella laminariae]|uniref:Alpha-E domain-containing protein n=1 Tax=Kiloniella laminariae TaxID=454162 RepID=A0ABT4LFM9_9PROT|nr:alpha-E domain-containing protein [Kiloniella laminariae]MCZ4279902.1 alpha-E domain-containing protein [Kiloniella laminariae]
MLSRVANSIYWMSRYLERADNVARFIDVNARLILDMGWERESAQWDPLVLASGDEADFKARYSEYSEKQVVHFLTFDEKNPNSIISCINSARENARTVREIISSEMWEAINTLYHLVDKHSRKRKVDDLQSFFISVNHTNHLFAGMMENTMSHGEGWHFARAGKMLERADKTARMLDVKYFLLLPNPDYFDSPYDTVEWGAVLKSVSGFEVYRKRYHRANYRHVTQFLVLDEHFARSIRYCVRTAARSVADISKMLEITVPVNDEFARLEKMLDEADLDTILSKGLHEFVDAFQFNLNVIDQSLYKSFFALERD